MTFPARLTQKELQAHSVEETGFDAYATVVVDCDNQGPAFLWTDTPAPQPGDRDHYDTFILRLSSAYANHFGS